MEMKTYRGIWLIFCLIFLLSACTAGQPDGTAEEASQGATWQEQYDLGIRYLSEGSYEEAIIAFTAAIEIDPKRIETYCKLSDAYVGMGETKKAVQMLYDAIQVQGNDSRLISALGTLGFCIDSNGMLLELNLNNILQGAKRTVDEVYAPDLYESYLTYDELREIFGPIVDLLRMYIDNYPDDSQGYYYLGGIYCMLNEMDYCLQIRQEGFLKTGDVLLTPSNHSRAYEDYNPIDCDAWGRVIYWEDGLSVPHIYVYGDGAELLQRTVKHESEQATSEFFYENGRRISMNDKHYGTVGGKAFEFNRIYNYEYPGNDTCVKRYWMVEEGRDGYDFTIDTFDAYGNRIIIESYDSVSGELQYCVEW